MESLAEFARRVRFWLHRSEANRELEEEMQFHLQMKARQYQEAGMPEREAPFAARRQFGNPLLLKELSTQAWGWRSLETILQDVKFAGRAMKRDKAFTAVAVLTLALGIGANAIMFSLVDGVWTRPIPVRDPRGLVHIFATDQKGQPDTISYPDYLDFKAQAHSLADLLVEDRRGPTLKGDGWTQPTLTVATSPNYFTLLGVGAQAGRMYTDHPEPPGVGPILVLSYNLWQRRFHGDPSIVGKALRLMDTAFTVVGVAAKGFRGTELGEEVDLWIPMASWDVFSPNDSKDRRFHDFVATGRLRHGATPEQPGRELPKQQCRARRNAQNRLRVPRSDAALSAIPAVGNRRSGPADRMRQRGEPAAGARRGADPGNWDAAGAWLQPAAIDPAVAHREPGAGRGRGRLWARARCGRHPVAARVLPIRRPGCSQLRRPAHS
jgi:hypothetical protein